jgi:hypothetical protein
MTDVWQNMKNLGGSGLGLMTTYNSHVLYFVSAFVKHGNELWVRQGKGKAVPLQAYAGTEGSSSLRLPDYMTIGK